MERWSWNISRTLLLHNSTTPIYVAMNKDVKNAKIPVQRVQTGVRIEKRLLKVLKALAEYFDMSLGDLLEGIVLHAFDGKSAFTDEETLARITQLKNIYGLELDSSASHQFVEEEERET
jgi:hypothetical protein